MRKIFILVLLTALAAGFIVGCSARSAQPGDGSEKAGGGIAWTWNDLQAGKQQAAQQGKKIFLYIGGSY